MNVLVVGGTGKVGHAVGSRLKEQAIPYIAPSRTALDLARPEQIQAYLAQYQPRLVVNAASYNNPVAAENEPSHCYHINRDATAVLADCCQRQGCHLLHVSTYRVFDGAQQEAYTEDDTPNPCGVLATSRWQAEQQIRTRCSQHIILRLSWVISDRRKNLLTRLLDQVARCQEVTVTSDRLGCPTPADDVARVIVAISQQIACGATAWGTYHYAAREPVSENSFAETVIAQASLYKQLKIHKLTMGKMDSRAGVLPPANASLACTAILNAFGIHTRPWRNDLPRMIRNYYRT